MDLLYWKTRARQTEVLPTTKAFYKLFLYKMTVYAPGCRSIVYGNVESHLRWREQNNITMFNRGGSWYNKKMIDYLKQANINHLKLLQKIRLESFNKNIKVRVEEPYVDIYTDSEQQLKEYAEQLENPNWVKSVHGPEDKQSASLLTDHKILRKRKPKFKYKITFKDKKFSTATKTAVWNYLNGLGNEVKLPKSMEQQLTKKHEWIWGCYFYTDDPGIVSMIQLINPDIVREVSELVQVDTK